MPTNITFEFCDWRNTTHVTAFLSLLNHYMSDPMGDHIPLSKEEQMRLIKSLLEHPTVETLLMKSGEDYVAMVTFFTNFSTFHIQPFLYLHDVVVLEGYRGQGLGKQLIEKLTAIAKERGCCKLSLEVREDNPGAKKAYHQLGFDECQPKMHYWEKLL